MAATLPGVAAERASVLMCACTDTFTCYRCRGTRFDPDYFATLEPVNEEQFDDLMLEPQAPPIMFGSEE